MTRLIVLLIIILCGALYVNSASKARRAARKPVNYEKEFKEDERKPSSLNYALVKVTSKKSYRVPASVSNSPVALALPTMDSLMGQIKSDPDGAIELIRKLTKDPDGISLSDKKMILVSLETFRNRPEAAALAIDIFRAYMKDRRAPDPQVDYQLRVDALNVVLSVHHDGRIALQDVAALASDERDLELRFKLFQMYAKKYPQNRADLLNQMSRDDIRFAHSRKRK